MEIDLSTAAAEYDRGGIRPRRLLMLGFLGLGVLMVILGSYLLLQGPASSGTGVVILLLGGFGIIVAAAFSYSVLPSAARRIKLIQDRVSFELINGRTVDLMWDSPKSKIVIYDWRNVTVKSRGLAGVEFVVSPNVRAEASVDQSAVTSLIREAEKHGYTVTGWKDHPAPSARGGLIRIARAA